MGSMAQDRRHEEILESCQREVDLAKQKVARLKVELVAAEEELIDAERALRTQREIDRTRE